MLKIVIPGTELYNEETGLFSNHDAVVLELEHSLRSLSKWESKWKKPFLTTQDKTAAETIDYIQMMTLNSGVDPEAYLSIGNDLIQQVIGYMGDPMTATVITDLKKSKQSKETITAELIYYQMTALNIPFECQDWHLNRLFTLIRVCGIKQSPDDNMSAKERNLSNAQLNEARKKKYNSKG